MNRQQRIEQHLRAALEPNRLEVVDESHLHAGHAGASPAGETHYHVIIESAALAAQNRVERQRRVNQLLQGEFTSGLHALRLTIR